MKTDISDSAKSFNVVDHLVATFFDGVQVKFIEFIDRPQGTVSSWKKANAIPHKVMRDILRRARLAQLELSPADFFPEYQDAANLDTQPLAEAG